jgi:hypothetical protein
LGESAYVAPDPTSEINIPGDINAP